MSDIKFGTDGWRAIIAKEFTVSNVSRVAYATAEWTIKNFRKPSIVIGHDCRFGGKLFVETAVKVFISKGIKVYMAKSFISTPMLSMGVKELKASLGVVITASHNPPEYNGYKLKGHFGGPLSTEKIDEVESLIPSKDEIYLNHINIENQVEKGNISIVDLEEMYIKRVQSSFDLDAIRKSGLNFAYDAMYGAGQNVMKKLFPEMTFLHCDFNPSFMGQSPEPIDKNLQKFSNLIKEKKNIAAGLATDGDADRIGLYNSKGEFVDSHHIILLLFIYLYQYKKMNGKVVVAASTTPRVTKLAEKWGLDHDTVKVGFKYIASQIVNEDVLIGGEESGGIAIKGHIPERDGIWMGLVLFEYMAKSRKTLDELVLEVYELVGEFKYCRDDLHIPEELKVEIIKKCNQDKFTAFGKYNVESIDKTDGFKFILNDDQWLMIRPSGTEPVLRFYAESKTLVGARAILNACKKTIGIN